MKWYSKRKHCVGLDIGSHTLKACWLRPYKDTWLLEKTATARISEDAIVEGAIMHHSDVVYALKELVPRSKFRKPDVAFAVSGPSVVVKRILVQQCLEEDLKKTAMWEAERHIPFDLEEMYVDLKKIEVIPGSDRMSALLVASKKDFINEYVETIREAGLNPVICDVAGLALEETFLSNYVLSEDTVYVLLNIGHMHTTMNVVVRGKTYFVRDFSCAGLFIEEEIKKTYGISSEEAVKIKTSVLSEQSEVVLLQKKNIAKLCAQMISKDIRRALDFIASENVETKNVEIVMSGGASQFSFLQEELSVFVSCPVKIMDPFRKIDATLFGVNEARLCQSYMGVVLGLAMRSVKEGL